MMHERKCQSEYIGERTSRSRSHKPLPQVGALKREKGIAECLVDMLSWKWILYILLSFILRYLL